MRSEFAHLKIRRRIPSTPCDLIHRKPQHAVGTPDPDAPDHSNGGVGELRRRCRLPRSWSYSNSEQAIVNCLDPLKLRERKVGEGRGADEKPAGEIIFAG